MEINPYQPPSGDLATENLRSAAIDLPRRPVWKTATVWFCAAAIMLCGVVIAASIYEIVRTRTAPPGPFAADYSNSFFGNRSMERTAIKMVGLACPFAFTIWWLRARNRQRVLSRE